MEDVRIDETVAIEIEEYVMDKKAGPRAGGNLTARKRWQVAVDVYLNSVDPLDFHIESPIQSAPDTDLIFHNNCHPGFEIVFTLHDETADPNGYSFVKPKDDAIWSQMGEGPGSCPTEAPSKENTVLNPQSLSQNAMTLVVINENVAPHVGPFQYTLRVTNGDRTIPLDPGGNNMNGVTNRV
jgi:hypothetical protein